MVFFLWNRFLKSTFVSYIKKEFPFLGVLLFNVRHKSAFKESVSKKENHFSSFQLLPSFSSNQILTKKKFTEQTKSPPPRHTGYRRSEALREVRQELSRELQQGTSPRAPWWRLHAFNAGGTDSIFGQGTKIPYASWCGQKINFFKKMYRSTLEKETLYF